MRVLKASAMGLCFGVRDALQLAHAQPAPQDITIWGELVHNEEVLAGLEQRGFRMSQENDRGAPATPHVLITAHGVSDAERARLLGDGKQLIDTTCPLVARAHQAAQRLEREGFHVIVIGKPGHVEVRGLVGDLADYDVVPSPAAAKAYPHPRLGVVCQTTCTVHDAQAVLEALRAQNPEAEIRFVDTICEPTKQRIRALEALLEQVDAMVVVGGRNSNNTQKLVQMCAQRSIAAHHVQSAGDLDPRWFVACGTVGLTAGTSTPDATVDAVHQALCELGGAR